MAPVEVEGGEGPQLSESFGEWEEGQSTVQGWFRVHGGLGDRYACTTCRLNCVEACWERQ